MPINRRRFASVIALGVFLAASSSAAWGRDTVRIVHLFSEGSPIDMGLVELVPTMERQADYAARFEIYPATVLGIREDVIRGVLEGWYDFLLLPPSLFAFHRMNVGPLSRSDLFWSSNEWRKLKGSDAEAEIMSMFDESGFQLMGSVWLSSERLVARKEIRSVEDLKGMRVGVDWGKDEFVEWFPELGASMVTLPWNDVYTALHLGTIDGSVQAMDWVDALGAYEGVKTVIRNPVGGHVGWLLGRRDWGEGMRPTTADLVRLAVVEAMHTLGTNMEELEEKRLSEFVADGGAVVKLVDGETKLLHDAIGRVWDENLSSEDRRLARLISGR